MTVGVDHKRFEVGVAWLQSQPVPRYWFLYDMVEKDDGTVTEIWISKKE